MYSSVRPQSLKLVVFFFLCEILFLYFFLIFSKCSSVWCEVFLMRVRVVELFKHLILSNLEEVHLKIYKWTKRKWRARELYKYLPPINDERRTGRRRRPHPCQWPHPNIAKLSKTILGFQLLGNNTQVDPRPLPPLFSFPIFFIGPLVFYLCEISA